MTSDKSVKITNWLLYILLIAGFGLQLFIVYFGYKTYHYIVPPGSDVIQHFNIIQKILTTGKIDFLTYPPGFHLLVIFFSKFFHQDIFHILTYWTPILVVLPALCMFFLLRQLFDNKVSVITTLLFLLVSSYPMHNFIDGNYPDILAYGVYATLLFAFLIRYLRTKNWLNLIIASVFLLLIALTHQLTFVGVMTILFCFGLVQLYIIIAEKKLVIKVWCWKFLAGLVVLGIIALSIYFSVKFYGPTILKYADGFFSNNPALQNAYLNQAVDWGDYSLITGDAIWYLGIFGLLFLIITTFKQRYEVGTKQLVLIWFLFFFIMSRFAASAMPARFARELTPPLIVAIGFLLNYVFNLNTLRGHRYKLIFGYGLIASMILTSSALYIGPAKIPESFSNMVWFWQKDQDKIDYMVNMKDRAKDTKPTTTKILYNPYANLFMPIKTPNNFAAFKMTQDELNLTLKSDGRYRYSRLSTKQIKALTGYNKLIYDLRLKYADVRYIFLDVKPPSNPDGKVYPRYSDYEVYYGVLDDMAKSGTLVKNFPDGARLIKMF